MPEYCSYCCHVGHGMANCMVLGQKSGTSKLKLAKKLNRNSQGDPAMNCTIKAEDVNRQREVGGMDVEKRKADSRMAAPKQGKIWQVVNKGGRNGAKDMLSKDKEPEKDPQRASIPTSNRFQMIVDEEAGEQSRMEKQGQTEVMNSSLGVKNLLSSDTATAKGRREKDAVMTGGIQEGRRLGSDPKNILQQPPITEKDEDKQTEKRASITEQLVPTGGLGLIEPVGRRSNVAATAAAFSVKLQTVEDDVQLHFHNYGMHGQAGKNVGDCVNNAESVNHARAVDGEGQVIFHVNGLHGHIENIVGEREMIEPKRDEPPLSPAEGRTDTRSSPNAHGKFENNNNNNTYNIIRVTGEQDVELTAGTGPMKLQKRIQKIIF